MLRAQEGGSDLAELRTESRQIYSNYEVLYRSGRDLGFVGFAEAVSVRNQSGLRNGEEKITLTDLLFLSAY